MVRRKRAPEKTREEPRLDSGAALSDPAVLSGGSAKGELMMPTLRNTNWNYGASKARYRKTELQLRQPNGFPIKPLKITLERAREEAELETAVKRYADPEFEIYEDCKEDDYDGEVEPENEEADSIAVNTPDDFEYSSADDSADESDASAELPASKVISEKPVALIDSLGRTRAATSRRKAQEVSDSTKLPRISHEDKENVIVGNKKRKRGNRQAAKQPRKTLPKKSV